MMNLKNYILEFLNKNYNLVYKINKKPSIYCYDFTQINATYGIDSSLRLHSTADGSNFLLHNFDNISSNPSVSAIKKVGNYIYLNSGGKVWLLNPALAVNTQPQVNNICGTSIANPCLISFEGNSISFQQGVDVDIQRDNLNNYDYLKVSINGLLNVLKVRDGVVIQKLKTTKDEVSTVNEPACVVYYEYEADYENDNWSEFMTSGDFIDGGYPPPQNVQDCIDFVFDYWWGEDPANYGYRTVYKFTNSFQLTEGQYYSSVFEILNSNEILLCGSPEQTGVSETFTLNRGSGDINIISYPDYYGSGASSSSCRGIKTNQ